MQVNSIMYLGQLGWDSPDEWPPGLVYIGSTSSDHDIPQSEWANEFEFDPNTTPYVSIVRYGQVMMLDPEFRTRVMYLDSKVLVCEFAHTPCHGEFLAQAVLASGDDVLWGYMQYHYSPDRVAEAGAIIRHVASLLKWTAEASNSYNGGIHNA